MPIAHTADFFIQWHLTERCNLRCTHCYQTASLSTEMTTGEAFDLIDEAAGMIAAWENAYGMQFSPSMNITGGEPLLRRDLFAIVEKAVSGGFSVSLLSNGILIDDAAAGRLSDAGISGVQVSIEGPEPVHDAIRGSGSFSASINGIRRLAARKIPVTMNTTLSTVNADSFDEIIAIARAAKASRLGYSRLVPTGRGAGMADKSLTTGHLKELYERLSGLEPDGLELVTGDPVAANMAIAEADADDCPDVPFGGCAAGVSGLTIMPDGTVVPCRRMHIPLGNVRTDSLRGIWAASDVLNALRDKSRYSGKCGQCARWSGCRGCRAIAYAVGGSFLAEDPNCFL